MSRSVFGIQETVPSTKAVPICTVTAAAFAGLESHSNARVRAANNMIGRIFRPILDLLVSIFTIPISRRSPDSDRSGRKATAFLGFREA
jgi:hypothetical protein